MANDQKDIWDKIGTVGSLTSGVLIPIAIAVSGYYVSRVIKDSENQVKYIEIATSLLRDEPRPENAALRDWAIDILAANSKSVPLSPEAQAQLKARKIPIYTGGWDSGSGGNVSWNTAIPGQKPSQKK